MPVSDQAGGAVAVLFDTDIGSDIDDAVALAYLLSHPRCELAGITTVSGDTPRRAACAAALCATGSSTDVPIHAGLTGPLLRGAGQPEVPQYAAIADLAPTKPWPIDAIDFMRATIRSRPGEIELLSVGPLTNVAALFTVDPEIPGLLKGFTSMAGVYLDQERRYGEWNVLVDPVAAAIAMRQAPSGHRCIGLDVTRQATLDKATFVERFGRTPLLQTVLRMAEVWFRDTDAVTFHDPLAAAVVFEPTLCGFETGKVRVAYGPDAAVPGATTFTRDAAGRQGVATTVDADRFFAEYFARTLAESTERPAPA